MSKYEVTKCQSDNTRGLRFLLPDIAVFLYTNEYLSVYDGGWSWSLDGVMDCFCNTMCNV